MTTMMIGSTVWVMELLKDHGWNNLRRQPVRDFDMITATRGDARIKVNVTAAGSVTFRVRPVGGFPDIDRKVGIAGLHSLLD